MEGFNLDEYMETYRKLNDSMSSTVKIDHSQVCILVVKDLIAKRNSPTNKIVEHFDAVLRYYIDEDEFTRFVLNGEEVV